MSVRTAGRHRLCNHAALRHLLPRAAFLAGLAGLALTNAAHAQDVSREVGVMERPRPAYDPRGIRLGSFIATPSIDISETVTDNVFATEDDTESDFITTIQPAIRVTSDWSRHSVSFSAFGRTERYLENQSENTTTFGVQTAGNLDISAAQDLSGAASYSLGVQPRTDPESDIAEEPATFDHYTANLAYQHNFNRLLTGVDAAVERIDFRPGDAADQDRLDSSLGLQLGYQVGPRLALFGRSVFERQVFDTLPPDGISRDTTVISGLVGADYELRSLLVVNFSAGYFRSSFDEEVIEPVTGLALSGSATWYPSRLTTVRGNISRATTASTLETATSRETLALGVTMDRELRRNLLFSTTVDYTRDNFSGLNRLDNVVGAQVSLRYLINRNASAFAGYGFRQRWSTAEDADFTRNALTIGLRLQI